MGQLNPITEPDDGGAGLVDESPLSEAFAVVQTVHKNLDELLNINEKMDPVLAAAAETTAKLTLAQASASAADESATEALSSKTAAEAAVTAAGLHVIEAEEQVSLAATQVVLATDQAALAATQVGLAADQVTLAATQAGLAADEKDLAASHASTAAGFATAAEAARDAAITAKNGAEAAVVGLTPAADLASAAVDKGAALVGYGESIAYGADTVGKAVKDLYGVHAVSATDPAQDGGLIGLAPDGNSTKAAVRHAVSLTGSRTKAKVALGIEVSDSQSGPASGPGSPTPDSASYGLSIVNYRPNWNTSGATGEVNGINVFIRQANSDAAGMLSNILTRSGFGATLESYTGSADAAGAVIKAVNVQAGVVNSRDGGEYGFVAQATDGTNLTAAFSSREIGSATWANAFEHNSSTTTLWWVRAADGATFGGSFLPRADLGANVGAPTHRFDAVYSRRLYHSPYSVSQLPAASGNQGARAFVTDATVAASGNFGSIVTGGGSNPIPVYCDGTDWRIG